MHVVERILGVVDDVALDEDAARSLVIVDAHAAVDARVDTVDQVVADFRAGLRAEQVDGPHIGKNPLADVMDVVVFDEIALDTGEVVTPAPAHGNPCVVSVVDVISVLGPFISR